MTVSDSRTVLEEASLAFEQLLAMEQKVKRLHQEMAERTDYESDDYHALIQRATDMQEQLHFFGHPHVRGRSGEDAPGPRV